MLRRKLCLREMAAVPLERSMPLFHGGDPVPCVYVQMSQNNPMGPQLLDMTLWHLASSSILILAIDYARQVWECCSFVLFTI